MPNEAAVAVDRIIGIFMREVIFPAGKIVVAFSHMRYHMIIRTSVLVTSDSIHNIIIFNKYMAKVYFYKFQKQSPQDLSVAGKEVSDLIAGHFSAQDNLAVKVHFGERGNHTYLKPDFTWAVCEGLDGKVKSAAMVECTVLYKGERSFASSHKRLALEHGFDFLPVDILDGENGNEEVVIPVQGKHFDSAKIGRGIEKYDALLVISHFKGHMATGYGGALKNIGMGLGSKGGKMAMHKSFKIASNPDVCKGCGQCCEKCPGKAISLENGKAKIEYEKCLGCGLCISVCPYGAIEIPWQSQGAKDLQEKIAEYAAAVLKGRKAFFVNVLVNITEHCDCMGEDMVPMMEDIGVLLSDDIVALETASLDLAGRERFNKWLDPEDQINHAVEMGLGQKEYTLVRLN